MIAEIRSYGTSIIIADQSPTKVGRNIVANTNVKVIFKLVEKENKDAISTATNMNEADYDLLGRLESERPFCTTGVYIVPCTSRHTMCMTAQKFEMSFQIQKLLQ